jgi:hypothetical protein
MLTLEELEKQFHVSFFTAAGYHRADCSISLEYYVEENAMHATYMSRSKYFVCVG